MACSLEKLGTDVEQLVVYVLVRTFSWDEVFNVDFDIRYHGEFQKFHFGSMNFQ